MDTNFLRKLGFSDKVVQIYLNLLRLGPCSVRKLAEQCGFNRGTTYDALKWLQEQGVVNFYKEDSKQHFVAEDPAKLEQIISERRRELDELNIQIDKVIPELQALHHKGGQKPLAKYFSRDGIKEILEDVLVTCEEDENKEYRIYSAEGIRSYLYENFPTFSDVRISKGISVKVIAIGEGGELRGLDERKWIESGAISPTYIIIYPGKTAYISLNVSNEPAAVLIENDGVFETQKFIFDNLWNNL